ncbi:uncharacterized protein FIBRA_01413 [Fibroporia radiculosa]|uniref:Uncharacterized protein n=1 Tax=Fibroporia radiculosa TaxID=599839 RepID=J4GK55_9APHY|nr:uncharacterized protein FIBRA_01413 [Fibroporia radiculosa]CCL99395.1 predicted protein [Fibroporia radiculosa]
MGRLSLLFGGRREIRAQLLDGVALPAGLWIRALAGGFADVKTLYVRLRELDERISGVSETTEALTWTASREALEDGREAQSDTQLDKGGNDKSTWTDRGRSAPCEPYLRVKTKLAMVHLVSCLQQEHELWPPWRRDTRAADD